MGAGIRSRNVRQVFDDTFLDHSLDLLLKECPPLRGHPIRDGSNGTFIGQGYAVLRVSCRFFAFLEHFFVGIEQSNKLVFLNLIQLSTLVISQWLQLNSAGHRGDFLFTD
jgi:hypothetical protein